MYKGIFWLLPAENHYRLETVKAKCEIDGTCFDDVRFSSKSGENFNHATEWRTLRKKIKDTHEFNYYPRGRVEIKNGKIRIFINADFNIEDIRDLILVTFDLKAYEDDVRFISDGSYHYKYSSDALINQKINQLESLKIVKFDPNKTMEENAEAASHIRCNICGKPFNTFDLTLGDNQYDIFVNYPSSHDEERIRINFCTSCYDKVLDTVLGMCKINPVVDTDWMDNCVEHGVIYSYGTPSLKTRHRKSHHNETPHYGQIPVGAKYLEEILSIDTESKFIHSLLPCIVYGPDHPKYKMYLFSTAKILQYISRFVVKNDNEITKPTERIYEKSLFTGMLETEEEVADRIARYKDITVSAGDVFKCIEAMKPLIVRWLAADFEMLSVSEYAYLIDYVIKRKGEVPYPERGNSQMEGLFPKNYEDFNYWEGIGEEFFEFN